MNNAEKKTTKLKSYVEKIKSNKKIQYFIVAACVLLLIVILFGNFSTNKQQISDGQTLSYVTHLENRLSNTLSKVKGAGKVSVVITVESGMETVLASKTTTTQTSNGTETGKTPIVVNGKTIVVKELYPEIIGVLIVAEGANDFAVLNRIQQATISLLDINVNQIEILSMK